MEINVNNCWEKLQGMFNELPWKDEHKNTEHDFRLSNSKRLCLKIGVTPKGITCKIQILQGEKAKETLSLVKSMPLPVQLVLFTGVNNKITKNIQNDSVKYIGFVNSDCSNELIIPFGDEKDVEEALQSRLDILKKYINEFVEKYEQDTKKGTHRGSTSPKKGKNDNTTKNEQTTEIDPRQWGLFEGFNENEYAGFPIESKINEIRKMGDYEVAYRHDGKVLFLSMNEEGYPVLDPLLAQGKRITLKQLVSWPMCAAGPNDEKFEWIPPTKENGKKRGYYLPKQKKYLPTNQDKHFRDGFVFPDGSGIMHPLLHPQFVFLGENWSESGNAGDFQAYWSNGYCDQANILQDSFLSGGYFTDYFKCILRTVLESKDIDFLHSQVKELDDNTTWYDVFLNIFEQEIQLLQEYFGKKPRYIFVWGGTTYRLLDEKFKALCKHNNIRILIFGRHYAPQDMFPGDTKQIDSCRRVYDSIENIEKDGKRKTKNDQRRYLFALLEDVQGNLVPYMGNSVENPL